METTFPDLEQGPLSDTSFQDDDDGGAAGLPDHLLTPTDDGAPPPADESTLLMERRRLMRLDLERLDDQPGEEQRSGIVFSPGGSEAYVFTGASGAAAAITATTATTAAAESTPREIHDPIFVEGDKEFAAANQRTRELMQDAIHERLGHIKSALGGGGMQSEEPSPRNFAAAMEHEFAASTTDDGSLASPRPGGTLQHPGRATSPSVASVASSTASGLTTGRKNLEWDSGADLGYLGDLHAQEEAAATLSTLEKMAIGNYTSFLRSPERGGARSKGGHPTKQDLDAMHRRLKERQQTEDDMRQERLQKFADSLMKQRNLRKMTATKQAGAPTAAAAGTTGQQKRSKSRESKKSTPDSSPSRRSERPSRRRSKSSSAAVKSHSLSDLKDAETAVATDGGGGAAALRAYMSNSDLAGAQLLPDYQARQQPAAYASALLQRIFTGSSEPSSVSSAATVVATVDAAVGADEGHLDHLRSVGTDPQSIPGHLQEMMFQHASTSRLSDERSDRGQQRRYRNMQDQQPAPDPLRQLRSQASSTSLCSRQSASRSFETVINMGLQHQQHQRPNQQHPEARQDVGEERRWATRENLVSTADSEENTEEESAARPPPRRTAWGEVGGDKRRRGGGGVSRTSSGSTSDDDKGKGAKGGSDGGGTGGGARSTLESTQIDRAKSFEYFPGESFPMQENSSSYEYLPGHMVADRPGTVVSNYDRGDEKDGDGRVSGVQYISSSSDASFAAAEGNKRNNQRSARRRIELEKMEQRREQERLLDLNAIAEELSDRSKDLLQAHVRKTKHFYKKVKRYLAYASSPSQTPEESRKKQEILDKLLEVMQHQESKLDEERPLSSQLGRITAMSNASAAVQTTSSLVTAAAALPTASSLSEEEPPSSSTRRMATETIATTTNVPTTTSSASAKSKKGSPSKRNLSPERVSFHEDKIGQLRALRKEIKRLERLEYDHLGRSPNKSCSSEFSSLASTTTNSTFRSDKIAMPPPPVPTSKRAMPKMSLQPKQAPSRPKSSSSSAKNVNRGGNRGRPVNAADIQAEPKKRPPKSAPVAGAARTVTGKVACPPSKVGLVRAGDDREDFGQTYPTPRDDSATATVGIQTDPTPRPSRATPRAEVTPREPVAYYLPMENSSPVKIGTKVLKKSVSAEGALGKENRSILANYVAGLDASAVDIDTRRKQEERRRKREEKKEEEMAAMRESQEKPLLTLQDALVAQRPDFLTKSERRQAVLRRAREQRLEVEERRRRWLAEVAKMPPEMRARAPQPDYPPVRVERLFSHRQMVRDTRRRYRELPEVRWKVVESKRRSAYRTNLVMRDIYNRRLQEKVLSGKVSMVTHRNVVDI